MTIQTWHDFKRYQSITLLERTHSQMESMWMPWNISFGESEMESQWSWGPLMVRQELEAWRTNLKILLGYEFDSHGNDLFVMVVLHQLHVVAENFGGRWSKIQVRLSRLCILINHELSLLQIKFDRKFSQSFRRKCCHLSTRHQSSLHSSRLRWRNCWVYGPGLHEGIP